MYYYIFEPAKTSYERSYIERIRDVAREVGIVSEMTQASPARSPEELAAMGIVKQYSTIVAVGDDSHINRVISQLMNLKPDFHYAVGIISTDSQSMLFEKWGFKKPEQACETLKFRKLSRFDLGLVEPNFYFLTSAKIECKKPTRVTLEVDHWRADAIIDRIEVSNNLYILVERFIKEPSLGKTAFNWLFGKSNLRADRSIFKAKIIRAVSDENLPIVVDKIVVGHTPCHIYRKPNALNIITKRDNISLEEDNQERNRNEYKEQK
ncbi:MAG: diacylglycerol kinase family protein [Candidatus Berkelbacteria bacterium]|nr:diacylglycerol kinase family protein [Candidatus Berkelbacteria bacterium]